MDCISYFCFLNKFDKPSLFLSFTLVFYPRFLCLWHFDQASLICVSYLCLNSPHLLRSCNLRASAGTQNAPAWAHERLYVQGMELEVWGQSKLGRENAHFRTQMAKLHPLNVQVVSGLECRTQGWKGTQVCSEPLCRVRKPLQRPLGEDGDFEIRGICFPATIWMPRDNCPLIRIWISWFLGSIFFCVTQRKSKGFHVWDK